MDCGRECVRSGGDGRFLSRSPSCRRCSCRSLSRPVRWRQSRAGLNSRFASQQRDVGLDLVTSVAGPSCQRHMLTLPVGVDGGATGPDVVRMRRSIRIANPLVPAAERSCGPAFAITEFATDSPLEGDGFEPLVPQREGMGLFETTLIGLWSLYLRGKQLTSPEGPGVCIRFAPAESPCLTQTRPLQVENRGFRAGVRRSVGGAVGGDAQGGAISHQRTAISLLAPIPVPPCCRHGLGCLGTCRFRLGIERGSGSRKAEHGPLLMPGGKRWRR